MAEWFRGWTNQLAGRLAQSLMGVAKRGIDVYNGDTIENSIARALGEWLEVDLALSSNLTGGPIRGSFTDVKLKPLVQSIVRECCGGLELDLERTAMAQMEILIDVQSILSGEECSLEFAQPPPSRGLQPEERLPFLELEMDNLSIRTHGVVVLIKGLTVQVNPPRTPGDEAPTVAPGFWTNWSEIGEWSGEQSRAILGERASVQGFAADILSNWLLMCAAFECDKIRAVCRLEQLPQAWLAADVRVCCSEVAVTHRAFFAEHRQRYEELSATNKVGALLYHLAHLPLALTVGSIGLELGDAVELCFGQESLGCGRGPGMVIDLEHDNWEYFNIQLELWSFMASIGPRKHPLVRMIPGTRRLRAKLCTILHRIDGNNAVLRRCYREDIGAEGAQELARLQQGHCKLQAELSAEESRPRQLELQELLEISHLAQQRFYQTLYWIQFQASFEHQLVVDVSVVDLTHTIRPVSYTHLTLPTKRIV
eukprot:TRINITY_DN55564_c0_g1_i1.p1 TRINITY_DN55564_c0_g1~~TRINITY_DN55564_c0_g1_i1.p1  ORF type:complete len:482 (-),score=116.91 TRINITY_DN55564_c0_g1_i1:130-1575(-)